MMLSKNTKLKVSSSDGDTDFFDSVAGVLQANQPRKHTSNIDRSNERKWLYTKKRQEAVDTPLKLLQTQTTQMT